MVGRRNLNEKDEDEDDDAGRALDCVTRKKES